MFGISRLQNVWLWSLILCLPISLLGQSQFLPASLGEDVDIYVLPEADQLTVLIRQADQSTLYVLDNHMEPIRQESWSHDEVGEDWVPLGLQSTENGAEFVYWDRNAASFNVYQIDYQSGNQNKRMLRDARTRMERAYWGTFSLHGELHMLRLARDANQIRICRFGRDDQLAQQVYTIDRPQFLEEADYNFHPIDLSAPQLALTDSYAPGKLYQRGDSIMLTLDTKGQTYVVELDLFNQTKSEYALPYLKKYAKGNSLLHEGALYQFFGDRDSMYLTVNTSLFPENAQIVQALGNNTELPSSQGPKKKFQDGRIQSLYGISEWLAEVDWTPNLAIGYEMQDDDDPLDLMVLGGVKAFVRRGVTGTVMMAKYEQVQLPISVEQPEYIPAARPGRPFLASKRITRLQEQPGFHTIQWQGQTWIAYPDGDGYQLELLR